MLPVYAVVFGSMSALAVKQIVVRRLKLGEFADGLIEGDGRAWRWP